MLHVDQPPGGRFPERWHASAAVRENLRDLNGWAMLAVDVIGKHRAGSGLPSLGSRSADPSRDPLSTITISRACLAAHGNRLRPGHSARAEWPEWPGRKDLTMTCHT
jgi:hypothetical protein